VWKCVWEHIVGSWKLKPFAAALAVVGASVGAAEAASIVYDNALRDTGGNSCNFTISCVVELTGADAAAGTLLTLGIDTTAAATDQDFFEFSVNAFGLGIGYIANGAPNVSKFPSTLTLSFDNSGTWVGGSFTAVQTNLPVVPGAETTPAIDVTGTGVNTTIFEAETNFNTRPGNTTQGASGFTPRSFTLDGGGISFLAGETYSLAFRDFGIARDNNEAFVQLNDMEFTAFAAPPPPPQAPPVPLPATAWMLISALGILGWRKYRAR